MLIQKCSQNALRGRNAADIVLEHFHHVLDDVVPLQPYSQAQGY